MDKNTPDFREVSEAYQTLSQFYGTRVKLGNFNFINTDKNEKNDWTIDEDDYLYEQQKREWYRQNFNDTSSRKSESN